MKPILKVIACALFIAIAFSVNRKNTLVVKIGKFILYSEPVKTQFPNLTKRS